MLSWLKKKSRRVLLSTYKAIFNTLTFAPKKKRLIVFESFNGRQYSDNPRAIYEFLRDTEKNYEMVWSVDRKHLLSFEGYGLNTVVRFSVKWLLTLPRASYWVTNSRFPLWFKKSPDTTYLQTWHGTPLKKLGLDIEDVKMPNTTTKRYHTNFASEANKWDYLVSPNKYSTDIFKKAFGYNGKIIETGYPRNDYLINNNNEKSIHDVKKSMNLPMDKKIILYAPTWRDDQSLSQGRYVFDIKLDLEEMQKRLGNEYIIILRMHYLISESIDLEQFSNFVVDYSKHEDIRDLYLVSDILITDYSSVFFDYSLLKRPIFFYVYDLENYRDELRGFYLEFEKEAPGPLLTTTEELLAAIDEAKVVTDKEIAEIENFRQKFTKLEKGKSTEAVVNSVFKNK